MGWPGSPSYRVTTATVASRLIGDDLVEDPWKIIPLTASVNNAKISDVFLSEVTLGLGARTERAFKQAKKPDKFAPGLPVHSIISRSVGIDLVRAHLESLHGIGVSIDYHYFAPLNMAHAGSQWLVDTHGYLPNANQVGGQSAIKGVPVYLEHMLLQLNVFELEDVEETPLNELPSWEGPANSRIVPWENPFAADESWSLVTDAQSKIIVHLAYLSIDPIAGSATEQDWAANGVPELAVVPDSEDPLVQTYGYSFEAAYGLTGAPIEDFLVRYTMEVTLDALGLDALSKTYFQTKYRVLQGAGLGTVGYFTHEMGAGTMPELEATATRGRTTAEFLPWIFFRQDFENLATEDKEDSTAYKQDKHLMRTLGMDYQDYADAIYESPDLADISQAFFMFGVPIDSDRDADKRYLYEFWYWLSLDMHQAFVDEVSDRRNATEGYSRGSDGVWRSSRVDDYQAVAMYEGSARMTLSFGGLSSKLLTGNSGLEVGECDSELLTQTHEYYSSQRDSYNSNEATYSYQVTDREIPVWRYWKQESITHYREVLVAIPRTSYKLVGVYGERETEAWTTEDSSVLVPLEHNLCVEHFKHMDRQVLYTQAQHFVINSYVKTRVSWYESATFRVAFFAAIVVVTIASLGSATAGVQALYATVLGAVGGVVAAVIITAIISIGIQVGLSAIFAYAAEELALRTLWVLPLCWLWRQPMQARPAQAPSRHPT